eukprot:m.170888 g.170888  ORF g.170888 m.170888 type:complete len:674 (-) comp13305_c0_seq1:128-2149(-)
MGRKGKRSRGHARPATGDEEDERFRASGTAFADADPEELDDEIDAFHRDRIPLDMDAAASLSRGSNARRRGAAAVHDEGEAGVVDSVLEIDEDGSSGDEDEEDEDDDEDEEDGDRIGQAAHYNDDLNSVGGSEDEDPEAAEERLTKAWGAKRNAFYDTDYVDPDYRLEEEELEMAAEEEAEALRLQRAHLRALQEEDYDVPELLAGRGGAQDKQGKGKGKKKGGKGAQRTKEELMLELDTALDQIGPFGRVAQEKIPRDMSRLSRDERLARVVETAPEALDLCVEVEARSAELEEVVKPALLAHAAGEPDHELHPSGLAYLQLRHRLLLVYLLNLGYYLYLRSLQTPTAVVAAHPCIRQIVRIRAVLEDLASVHDTVGPALEAFVAAATETASLNEEGSSLEEEDEDGEETMNGAADSDSDDAGDQESGQDLDEDDDDGVMDDVLAAHKKASASVSALHSLSGVSKAPVRLERVSLAEAKAQRAVLEKAGRKRDRNKRRAAAEIGDVAEGDDALGEEVTELRRQADARAKGTKAWPYNADGPLAGESEDDDEMLGSEDNLGDDDAEAQAFYAAVASDAEAKRAAKQPSSAVPAAWEDNTDDNRAITYAMKKNRGLTPSRKKEMRNPRVRHRNKFTKATKRRKGQVVEVRSQKAKYTGEAFGIRTDVTKGRVLK